MIRILLIVCIFCLVHVSKSLDDVNNSCKYQMEINVNITQLFVQKIWPDVSSCNKKDWDSDFHYTITSMEGPDIPPWLYIKYIKNNKSLYIFGAAPKDLNVEILELQVSITSLRSFNNQHFKLKILFNYIDEFAKTEIHLRISNLDIEEMLTQSHQNNLVNIFEEYFWKTSKGKLFVTFLAAAESLGYQLPLNPDETAGTIVHLGSVADFSEELLDLQNETMPLAKHCPSFIHKRITVDRFFRPKNFIIDWCSFRLVNLTECHQSLSLVADDCSSAVNNVKESMLSNNAELLMVKEALPKAPVHGIVTLFIFIPFVCVGVIIILWLSSFMCFNNKKLNDPYSDDYFETIFFICEDFIRKRKNMEEPTFLEG